MDNVQHLCKNPDVVIEAYNLLLQHRIVAITEPIHADHAVDDTGWAFECIVKVPYPNDAGIPHEVPLRVLIPEAFPREPVEVVSLSQEVSCFPHQDAESRKLCLPEEALAPRNAYRLVCYVKWAVEWLNDAASETLLNPGDPYELPDFSRKLLDLPLPISVPLIFDESPISYEFWRPHFGKSGHVECVYSAAIPAIFSIKFSDANRCLIRESDFVHNVFGGEIKIDAKWMILPEIRYQRHRPPQTYQELATLCSTAGLEFYRFLKQAWKIDNSCKFGMLLIGFPIPRIVGEPYSEIHWQPLLFQNYKESKAQKAKSASKGESRKPEKIWQSLRAQGCFSPSQQLPWGKVENVTHERLCSRGSYSPRVQSTSIACFGCGALGSSVAELLARGGVSQLNLLDSDSITFSNLCRHSLDGSSVGTNKAEALAERLARTNPLSKIRGFPVRVPLNSDSDETNHQVLADSHLFVDCTASESAFDWLDEYAIEKHKRLISLFFNFHAEWLTICISGNSTSCGDIFADLKRSIQQNQTPLDPNVYFYQPSKEEQIIEGAGCWHPTFPARNAHIQILAAHAVEILSHVIDSNEKNGFATIVERRSVTHNDFQPGSLVELVWAKTY